MGARVFALAALLVLSAACPPPAFQVGRPERDVFKLDLVIRRGKVVDGTGAPARVADVGIRGDAIVAIGDLSASNADVTVDAYGLTVAPGFINMLSGAQ